MDSADLSNLIVDHADLTTLVVDVFQGADLSITVIDSADLQTLIIDRADLTTLVIDFADIFTGVNITTIVPGFATHFSVTLPASSERAYPQPATITALDFINQVAVYTGTVHFSSSDGAAVLPANTTLTSGLGVFAVTFNTAGTQTLTATDTVTSSITGNATTLVIIVPVQTVSNQYVLPTNTNAGAVYLM